MKIESPAFKHNEKIPVTFSCRGENISPELTLSDIPREAQSLVLIMDDPDAVGGRFIHWTLWNIPPATAVIPENSVPEGAKEGITSYGRPGYGGPCPPSGTHRYMFKLYALDTKLDLSSSTRIRQLEEAVKSHVLEKAELIGLFSR